MGSGMRALAIDLGGTHALCAVVSENCVLAKRIVPLTAESGLAPLLPVFARVLRELVRECGIDVSDCSGVAMGFCGLTDTDRCRVLSTNKKFDDAPGLDLAGWCRDNLGLRLKLENDVRMALLGERASGAARGFEDAVMITLGTGFGGAAMIGGHLLRGKHYQAGCLGGHFGGYYAGRPCTCGNIGCIEAEASGWALPGICRGWPGFSESALAAEPILDFATLFRLADCGDRVAGQIAEHCVRVWSAGAVALIHAYDPEVVVIGGGVMQRGERLLGPVRKYIHEHAWTPWGKVEVCAAALGSDAGILGAAALLGEEVPA